MTIKLMKEFLFNSSFGTKLNLTGVVQEIFNFIQLAPNYSYKVVIGTDSTNSSNGSDFVTAIIILRIGNGGRYFWRHLKGKNFHSLRERIYQEIYLSLEIAQKLIELLKKNALPHFDLEIHVDVGQNGETKNLINEVVGVIRGSGFVVKTKPESFAASNVADRHL